MNSGNFLLTLVSSFSALFCIRFAAEAAVTSDANRKDILDQLCSSAAVISAFSLAFLIGSVTG